MGRRQSNSIEDYSVLSAKGSAQLSQQMTKSSTDNLQRAKFKLKQKWQHQEFEVKLGSMNEAFIVSGKTMTLAAQNGCLPISTDPPKDTVLMDSVAHNRHLDIVKYFASTTAVHQCNIQQKNQRDEGTPSQICTQGEMNGAAANGYFEVIEWFDDNRGEGRSSEAMNSAGAGGHLNVIKWLHEFGSERCMTTAMDRPAARGHLKVVKWLHDNTSAGCTTRAMDDAAMNDHFEVVKWLHHKRSEGCTIFALTCCPIYELNVVK
ncbi:hypothetical protein PHMEG_0004715 [Phytophthora megakarya]|uniref:Uncharacterized protein n=1 Tax=Phytophthora megakarya TaxID=4795 RepID=A0A225WT62_9STRA|nr:hypothetical protein PHMEG_0004715 [Phytophthora megakarya]